MGGCIEKSVKGCWAVCLIVSNKFPVFSSGCFPQKSGMGEIHL